MRLLAFVGTLSLGLALALQACGASYESAEARYTGALLACVDRAETLAESKACRADVDAKWGRLDAGGDR